MKNLFGETYEDAPKKERKIIPNKNAWENAFQKWSNDIFMESNTHYGACGFGYICNYCEDNSYGRPCVRALNAMCRDLFLPLDYTNKSDEYFKKCFDGMLGKYE
jgi:hypothetical protein